MNERTIISGGETEVARRLVELGFTKEFAAIIGSQLRTDFTRQWMLRYLAVAAPTTMEEVADELVSILDFRDSYAKRKDAQGANFNHRVFAEMMEAEEE